LQGEDYDRIKLLHIKATEAERLDRKKKKNPDVGFADYEQATARLAIASTFVFFCCVK
jgi:pre-mRNA-splicing factor SYF2